MRCCKREIHRRIRRECTWVWDRRGQGVVQKVSRVLLVIGITVIGRAPQVHRSGESREWAGLAILRVWPLYVVDRVAAIIRKSPLAIDQVLVAYPEIARIFIALAIGRGTTQSVTPIGIVIPSKCQIKIIRDNKVIPSILQVVPPVIDLSKSRKQQPWGTRIHHRIVGKRQCYGRRYVRDIHIAKARNDFLLRNKLCFAQADIVIWIRKVFRGGNHPLLEEVCGVILFFDNLGTYLILVLYSIGIADDCLLGHIVKTNWIRLYQLLCLLEDRRLYQLPHTILDTPCIGFSLLVINYTNPCLQVSILIGNLCLVIEGNFAQGLADHHTILGMIAHHIGKHSGFLR